MSPGLGVGMALPMATQEQASSVQGSRCDPAPDLTPPPLNFTQFLLHGFSVDWCRYTLHCLDNTTTTSSSQTPPTFVEVPTSMENSVTLIVIAAVVGVVILMAGCIMTCVCFCRRKDS